MRNLSCWNRAAILTHILALNKKKDSLWLQWIHHVYLKQGESIWEHVAPIDSNWEWKKLMEIKNMAKEEFQQNPFGNYSIAMGYKILIRKHEKLRWCSQVWCSWNLPKHNFILWLAMHRLATKDRVVRYNDTIDPQCIFFVVINQKQGCICFSLANG